MKTRSLGRAGHVEVDDDPSKDLRVSQLTTGGACTRKLDTTARITQQQYSRHQKSNRCKESID